MNMQTSGDGPGTPKSTDVTYNDFVIRFANVNGSGSASANGMFAKALFRMGIPVATRNIFPSNIQGLPTWFEVRVSEQGYLGRREGVDIMVAMNAETYAEDVASLKPGGYLFYDNSKALAKRLRRDDIREIGMPIAQLVLPEFADPKQRSLFKNITYLGALTALLNIDFDVIKGMVAQQYRGKDTLITPNIHALELGRQYAFEYLDGPLDFQVRASDAVGDRIMVDGNTAAALGAVYGGATVCAWYPITPSTSVAEAFEKHANALRVDPETGHKRFAVVQAEDELSAIGIVIGAGWNGARSFTATSGPGISLMTEFLGLAYFAEIPAVIWDIQRAGPSTGMPTRTQQGDLLSSAYASHGDTKHVCLFPSTPKECFDMAADAFDLADRLQTPVLVLSDLELGMNDNLSEPFQWDDARRYDRGKVFSAEDLEAIDRFGRYLDLDGDGIGTRTLPGTHPDKGSFFTRGTSRDEYAAYTESPDAYVDNMERLERKWETAATLVPAPEIEAQGRSAGILYYGTSALPMDEARDLLRDDGIELDSLRLRAFPFSQAVFDFIAAHDFVFVVDQNRDAQMRSLLMLEGDLDPAKLVSVRYFGGSVDFGRHDLRTGARVLQNAAPAAAHGGWLMTFVAKPRVHHPKLPVNEIGLTRRDYEGSVSTLCAGCGHDSVSAAVVQACAELSLPPHRFAKVSGIGCSSKTPSYFLNRSHGFNSVHGRMPSVATGANLANRELYTIGVSGDGDSASIGLGQFAHVVRRRVNMLYIVDNNGTYGLTKGQFSATNDKGSTSKRGVPNLYEPIDLVSMALQLGATFVGRSFSGDRAQLVPLIKAGLMHEGFAFIDVVSPCVAFNNHEGSTKSYVHMRDHMQPVVSLDLVASGQEITADYAPGTTEEVAMPDGSVMRLHKVAADYDPRDHVRALNYVQSRAAAGDVVTGLLYVDETPTDCHQILDTVEAPLNSLSESELCPGGEALERINAAFR